jgi:hypothetical protein
VNKVTCATPSIAAPSSPTGDCVANARKLANADDKYMSLWNAPPRLPAKFCASGVGAASASSSAALRRASHAGSRTPRRTTTPSRANCCAAVVM